MAGELLIITDLLSTFIRFLKFGSLSVLFLQSHLSLSAFLRPMQAFIACFANLNTNQNTLIKEISAISSVLRLEVSPKII